ncbi:hypothetical protein DFH09DRAFT_1153725 [Mycena vulgaris]|nr:hypothetical protein DFH09DRAFT_1153725 [Mycena vulgaris]
MISTDSSVIAGEGIRAEELVPNKWTTRMCDLPDCKNYEKLNKCARCRTAMYCSKECQRADWVHHKPCCKLATDFPPPVDPQTGGEPPLRRHLRLWNSRFDGSLVCAVIVALELNKHPENIDSFGLVISLQPRPHVEAGSRFDFHAAVVMPMAKIAEVMALQKGQARGPNTGPGTMELHKQHRDELKERSGGLEDFAAVLVMAENIGPHALPGGPAMEIRFKPIAVHRHMIRSAQLNNPTLDWYLTLEFQVKRDRPNQSIVE